MSLTLLLEKYDVSTEEGLQKALNEIEKEECEVNESLSNALSRACTLEGRLRAASQAYSKLGEVRNDAQVATDMVDKTAGLARDVSAKVRQLDLARSRVAECQRRVHDLIDLRVCSAGVEAAIEAQDYETAAAHVSRFLCMEPGSVAAARARGPDPRQDMDAAAATLRDRLLRKFQEAAKREDDAAVERLFELFPRIGRAEEGVDLLAGYLASQLEVTLRRAGDASSRGGAVFVDALTRALEAGAAALERLRRLLPPAPPAPPALLPRALRVLQPTVCACVRRLSSSLVRVPSLAERPEPLLVEAALAELALAHSRMQLYFNFLRRRAEPSAQPLPQPPPQPHAGADGTADGEDAAAVERLIADCDMTRSAQDVLGQYLTLERYFLEESIGKALKLSTPAPGATASSLVDDAFYIARKVIRRGISTGSVDGACCVLNEAGSQLERAARALRRRLAQPPPDALPLAPPRAPPPPPPAPEAVLYLAQAAEAEAGARWAERLAHEAAAEAEALCRGAGAGALAKLRSCAAGLADAAAAFRAALDLALAALRAALLPAVTAWADALVDPDGDADESEEEAGALAGALDALAEAARAHLPLGADALLGGVLGDLAERARRSLLRGRYSRRAGLAAERRCRRVAAWAGGGAPAARERAGALSAAAALLALERLDHAPDALAPAALSPAEAREVLARRTDFKPEDIRRLKL